MRQASRGKARTFAPALTRTTCSEVIMAAEPHSSTRRRVLGAAAALPVLALAGFPASAQATVPERGLSPSPNPAQALWNRRLARYRRLHARWKAEAETGAFRAANDLYYREQAGLSARFGSWEKARRSRIGKPLCAAAFARVSAAEDAYYDRCTAPMHRAAIRLALTPAPDLQALLVKINLILEHQFETFDCAVEHPYEVLRDDVRRLAIAARRQAGGTSGEQGHVPFFAKSTCHLCSEKSDCRCFPLL